MKTGATESFINITEPSGKYKTELAANKKEVKWFVKFSGHPVPTLVWRDIHGHPIAWSTVNDRNNPESKYEAIQDTRSTTLKIRYPKINDSGNYTLYANNGKMQKEQKFQLLVKGTV